MNRVRWLTVGRLALMAGIPAVFLFLLWRSLDFSYFSANRDEVLTDLVDHIRLTVTTLAIAIAIAVPLGTLIARVPVLYVPLIGILGVIYTIPSLALLAYLVTLVGIGLRNAVIALVAYAQFILVRNVVVGLRSVDRSTIDAARGMGMNTLQILFKIEYPLALPVMLGGLRIATVATIAIATIASLVGAGGLGQLLFDGINSFSPQANSEIQVGAVAVSLLAVAADLILRIVDRLLPATRARLASR